MSILTSPSLLRFYATFAGSLLSAFFFGLVYPPDNSWAEDSTPSLSSTTTAPSPHSPSGAIFQLPPVTVIASPEPMTGHGMEIQGEILGKLPLGNNSLNEALGILPGVQFSDEAFLSTQGGEILPPQLSIFGGKGFENNFTIDGISNNSLLDPASEVDPVNSNADLPGHAQELFLDASLVNDITVYDSNVPASYGGFKGGMVKAETLNPDHWPGGRLFYRTTRDSWTKFHVAREKREDFANSGSHKQQPKFTKHHTGLDLHLPLSDNIRSIASYRLLQSKIPLKQFGVTKNQERRQENFFFKAVYEPSRHTEIDFSWLYTPYSGTYFKKDYRNSELTLDAGGFQTSVGYRTLLPFASLDIKAAYKESENSREAPAHMVNTQYADGSWDRTGFLGDLTKSQKSIQANSDLALHKVATGPVSHQINLGFESQHIRGIFDRPETSYIYTYRFNRTPSRNAYYQSRSEAQMLRFSAYLENIMHFQRLEFRPGFRLEYDDFLQNLNLAPRLAAALDIFGNHNTILIAGINRYYANPVLTYKLREALVPQERSEQDPEGNWNTVWSGTSATKFSSLETPYADEYVLGLDQALLGGRVIFKYVQREGREELAEEYGDIAEDGVRYYTLNNYGRSRYKSYRLAWERQWRQHYVNINASYQETTSSNESYDDRLEEENLEDKVWYDGRAISKTDLPRKDFNRPWVVNLTYVGRFPYGFSFSGTAKYRSGYRALEDTGDDMVLTAGDIVPIYDEVKRGGSVILSCSIEWEKQLYQNQSMVLSLEITNLLNKKASVADSDDYEIGRQIWAGMEYRF